MLVQAGGQEIMTKEGIPAYPPPGERGGGGYMGSSSGAPPGEHGGSGPTHQEQQSANEPGTSYDTGGVPDYESGPGTPEQSAVVYGEVDAENEYLPPDKDHYLATQAAINASIKDMGDDYAADWNDWSKEQQDTYQLEMNKLKGTEGKNYSFYKGNKGTTNLSFNEHWKDAVVITPALKYTPNLRLLVSAANTFKENLTTDYGTWKYGAAGTEAGKAVDQGGWMGRVFNSDGSVNTNITESEASQLYLEAQNDLPFLIGGTTPQDSMVNKYFSNLNNSNLGISSDYLSTYNAAKANIANTLNMTPNTQQYGYGNTFNDNYARSMTSANPFFDELTSEGLI